MKVLRLRIAWVMVFDAIAALNFTAIRAVLDHRGPTSELFGMGALPMANVLVVGLLIGYPYRRSHRFLLGFEAIGAMALALYIVGVSLYQEKFVTRYFDLFISPYVRTFGPSLTSVYIVVLYSITVVMLVLPQVAFALVGGLVSHKLRIAGRPDRTRW